MFEGRALDWVAPQGHDSADTTVVSPVCDKHEPPRKAGTLRGGVLSAMPPSGRVPERRANPVPKVFRDMRRSVQALHAVRLWLMPQGKGGPL